MTVEVKGTVEDGTGTCAKQHRDSWPSGLPWEPYPGSLNVNVGPKARKSVMNTQSFRVDGRPHWNITINGIQAVAKTSRDTRTLEIMHKFRLRDLLNLANGDTVKITASGAPRVRLSASIMAHPVRQAEAEEVQASLDRSVEIVYDTNPVPSKNPAQRWATGRRTWETFDPRADWHMVIQDDAVVSPDLLAAMENALSALGPDGLVSAYTGTGRPDQPHVKRALAYAQRKGHAWMHTKSLCWGVAFALPTRVIEPALKWCSIPQRSSRWNYDASLGRYARDVLGWKAHYLVPSLVDHRDAPSLVGHGPGRVAHQMTEGSGLLIDWTQTPDGGLSATL